MTSAAIDIPGYQAGTWTIDPVHSDLSFVVRHLGIGRFRQNFPGFQGEIVTGESVTDSSVSVSVDLTTLDTGLDAFNQHLRSADYFDMENFPKAEFRSTGIRPSGDKFILDGELTLKGITAPVSLEAEVIGFGIGLGGDPRVGFSARGSVALADFGIDVSGSKLPTGTLIISETAQIQIEVEADLQK